MEEALALFRLVRHLAELKGTLRYVRMKLDMPAATKIPR